MSEYQLKSQIESYADDIDNNIKDPETTVSPKQTLKPPQKLPPTKPSKTRLPQKPP